jgi:hypothetical protein
MELNTILEEKNKQYTVNSNYPGNLNSKQYTVFETRKFVQSLNKRVLRGEQYLPFYCKAARQLGFEKLAELEKMALGPNVNYPARLFFTLILEERRKRGLIEPKAQAQCA